MNKVLSLMLIAALCSSCKYQSSKVDLNGDSVIETSIPTIKKDPNGYFRNYLAREIAYANGLYYKEDNAKYKLLVTVTEDTKSKITYMWDRDPVTNTNLGVFYPIEDSRECIAKVELVDGKTGKAVIPAFFVKASADYDYVNPTVRQAVEFSTPSDGNQSVLQYSLGQLDSLEGADKESFNPIYNKLAKKIVARLSRSHVKRG